MNRMIETIKTAAPAIQSRIAKIAIPALILAFGLLISSPLARAQYGTGHAKGYCGHDTPCTDDPPSDPPASVPEPSIFLQLGTGLSALAIVGRRLVAKKS